MQHVLAGDHIVSSDRISSLASSLPALGKGVTRTAYDLGNGSVLKIQHSHTFGYSHGNATEVAMWERVKASGYEEHFAEILAHDEESFAWIIQKKATRTATESELDDFVETVGYELDAMFGILCDLHPGNLGVIEDSYGDPESFVIIDYAISGQPSYGSPTCNCGDIDCRQCGCGLYPHGDCNCPTFAGHRRVTCHVSDCFATACVPIWLPTWFAEEQERTQGACALDHAPIGHELGRELRRIRGQLSLGI